MLGVYIHIPFCAKKCPYCDFYSVNYRKELADRYTDAVVKVIASYRNLSADTLYFGGGTPNLLGAQNISKIIFAAKKAFSLEGSEITLEANPESLCRQDISLFAKAGINRLSMGLQSSNEEELSLLGRKHIPSEVVYCVDEARKAGIDNISLDLMVGLEKQNRQSLVDSIKFCRELSIPHISAYLLKLEEGTPFYNNRNKMLLPDDDFSAELYEFMCGELVRCGYEQYEISNFAKDGKYSRHNIKYWKCEEYLGIGASAHGFFDGKRYYYQRSVENFINDPFKTVSDGFGGGADEFFMLGLRLKSGIDLQFFSAKFKLEITQSFYKKVDLFKKAGYLELYGSKINLTGKGFLVSNAIIGDLLSELGI